MNKVKTLSISALMIIALTILPTYAALAQDEGVGLLIIEMKEGAQQVVVMAISPADDSMANPDYKLLAFHWYTTANYMINPSNKYGFSTSALIYTLTTSANTWDEQTAFQVFTYAGTTTRTAGKRDGYNIVAFGKSGAGTIAVTYLWYRGSTVIETDTIMNTRYRWSLSGEAGKMDVQDIMTHEFGHWCGLADLYADADYWLTMYGYGDYGLIYARSLGLGDIYGLRAVYGA
jgi:hypothetical protein